MAAKKAIAPKAEPISRGPTREEQLAALRVQERIAQRMIAIKKSVDSLMHFTKLTMPDPEDMNDATRSRYQDEVHHRLIVSELEKVERGEVLRLAISVPPQFGKSELTSRRFPAWYMGRNPTHNLMFGTYSQEFAEKFGNTVRAIMDKADFRQVFPKVGFVPGSKSRSKMTIAEYDGTLSFLGRGGSGTGNPASLFIIDDPIKDAKEAQSATIREDVWNWYTDVVETRCNVFSAQIIIQTRWHPDDLIGRLTDPKSQYYKPDIAKLWRVINIPARFDPGYEEIAELLGKKIGEALWPARFPLETLAVKELLAPESFHSLYMGRPTPPDGDYFKADEIYTYDQNQMPKNFRCYMTGDLALTEDKKNDSTCVGVWLLDEHDNLYLHPDIYWDKKKADDSVEKILDMMERHNPMDTWWEKGQIDKGVGPFLKKRAQERKVYSSGITALPTAGDKGVKCSSSRGRMRMGKIFFPSFAPWWQRARQQLLDFTGSGEDPEDDFCDMVGLIGQALGKQIKPNHSVKVEGNVIKVGTVAWMKQHDRQKKREQRIVKARGGF